MWFSSQGHGGASVRVRPDQTGSLFDLIIGHEKVQKGHFTTSSLHLCAPQFKEFLGTYNKVTENCFMDCVKDFTSRDVRPEEVNRKCSWL